MKLNFSVKGAFACVALASAAIFGCQKTSLDEMGNAQALRTPGTTSSRCELYNISVAKTYDATLNQSTFTWTLVNTAPGNGKDGTTAQDLSHWDMQLCERAAQNIVSSTGSYIAVDPSMPCVSGSILKFDYGTSGSTPTVYTLVLTGKYSIGSATGYFKAGTDCCTRTFDGVSCVVTENPCSFSQGYWFANTAHSWNGQTVTLGGNTYTQAEGQALWDAFPGGKGGSATKVFYQASAIILSIPSANVPAALAADIATINAALTGLGKLTPANHPNVTDANAVTAAGHISAYICANHCGSTEVDPNACATF